MSTGRRQGAAATGLAVLGAMASALVSGLR
jgi:hypothetical protein